MKSKYICIIFFILYLTSQFTNAVINTTNSTNVTTTKNPNPNTTKNISPTQISHCISGINLGYMIIHQPNATSLYIIGKTYNISWVWSNMVTEIPSHIDVYIQNTNVQITWNNQILSKQSVIKQWFLWTPNELIDGKYKIRLVPDGKENFNNPDICYKDGECLPSVSATFLITNPTSNYDDTNISDPYPPNSSSKKIYNKYFIYIIIFKILFITII